MKITGEQIMGFIADTAQAYRCDTTEPVHPARVLDDLYESLRAYDHDAVLDEFLSDGPETQAPSLRDIITSLH